MKKREQADEDDIDLNDNINKILSLMWFEFILKLIYKTKIIIIIIY